MIKVNPPLVLPTSSSITKTFGPQSGVGGFSSGIELDTRNGSNWLVDSLRLIIENSVVAFVRPGGRLPHPLPNSLVLEYDSLVIIPTTAAMKKLKEAFHDHNKPAPQAFIYQNIDVRFGFAEINDSDSSASPELKTWYNHEREISSPLVAPTGLRFVPNDDMLILQVVSELGHYLDPVAIFKFLETQNDTDFDLDPTFRAFCGLLPDNLIIEVRDEWNQPLAGQIQITVTPSDGSPAYELSPTTQLGIIRIADANLKAGNYRIHFDSPDRKLSRYEDKQFQSFALVAGHLTDYFFLQHINLSDWFVTDDFGHRYTEGNQAVPYITGKEYFARAHELLAQDFDYVFFTNWRLDYDLDLLPIPAGTPPSDYHTRPSTIGSLLTRPGRRHKVYGILWDQKKPKIAGVDFVYSAENVVNDNAFVALNQGIVYDDTARYLRVWLDTREDALSHHQKTLIVSQNGALVAFCGGLDFAFQRWDDERHKRDSLNRLLPNPLSHPRSPDFNAGDTAPTRLLPLQPWHDVHVQIIGPAAHDIDANFRQRWEDAGFDPLGLDSESSARLFRQLNDINDRSPDISRTNQKPNPLPAQPVSPIGSGTHYAKIARTYNTRNFFTMMQNIIHCIRRARRLIYIEDQYLTSLHVAEELHQRLRDAAELVVIIVTGERPDPPSAITERNKFLNALGHGIVPEFPDRLGVYHLRNKSDTFPEPPDERGIYVHSKLVIVDDVWASISTTNLNNRSFTADTEIGALIVDGQLAAGRRKFAFDLRKRLWEQHFAKSISLPDLLDHVKAKALWEAALIDSRSYVSRLQRDPAGEAASIGPLHATIADPWEAPAPGVPDLDHPGTNFTKK